MNKLSFQIKICGVRNSADALSAMQLGAGAIGFNFYPRSKRFLDGDKIRLIRHLIDRHTGLDSSKRTFVPVGVLVNPTLVDIATACARWGMSTHEKQLIEAGITNKQLLRKNQRNFDWIQLHGDETPEFIAQIKLTFKLPVMRALRWGNKGGQPIDDYLQKCAALECLPDALLIDSSKPGEYGGTGETADWDAIAKWRENRPFDIPLVLAGGLTPSNVADAIRTVKPNGVDTASGVEASPGHKDRGLIQAFIEAARSAFETL